VRSVLELYAIYNTVHHLIGYPVCWNSRCFQDVANDPTGFSSLCFAVTSDKWRIFDSISKVEGVLLWVLFEDLLFSAVFFHI